MNFEFKLPDIGEGLVEGEIVKWFVKAGDAVRENDPLAAVLTDKAEVEVPSPKTGTIVKLFGKPGEKVKVHSPLVLIEVAGNETAPAAKAAAVLAAPLVRKLAKDKGLDLARVAGSGPQGRVLAGDLEAAPSSGGVKATPAVKALAAALGVDLSRVKATGPGGRVAEIDVRAAAKAQAKAVVSSAGDIRTPFVGIRRKIAEKMSASKHTVADVTHVDECDMTALLALRDELKPQAAKRGVKLTFLPFILKALTKALQEFADFNSSLDEAAGELVVKRYYNVGIAVAAPQGLVVPNIKNADSKDIFGLAAEIAALAETVRATKIEGAALQGGTITITNIGPLGGLYANPIVNHPEVAILALMKLQKRPVVRDGRVAIRDMMNLCLSFDHRVVDGADAAQFMNTLIRHLENPRTLL
ncbi:MAG: dihydrolipoamide acetyltransferase family protein [Elusimicrobiota bacterium]